MHRLRRNQERSIASCFLVRRRTNLRTSLKCATLFIVARDDTSGDGAAGLHGIRAQYEKAPQPKELIILEGSAHAQYLFQTDQGERVMREILRFLAAK